MFRIVLIFSLLPIVVAMLACRWFGRRVLSSTGSRQCSCDLTRWQPGNIGQSSSIRRSKASAAEFGRSMRDAALHEWNEEDPKAARARDKSRRVGAVVPALAAICAVFAWFVGKIPLVGVLAIFLATTALASAMSLLSLPAELQAIQRFARKVHHQKLFPDPDDEAASIACAAAEAWNQTLPNWLRWLEK